MEDLADLIARRQLTLQSCEEHIKQERNNTVSMKEVRQARASAYPGSYKGGPVAWDQEGDNE